MADKAFQIAFDGKAVDESFYADVVALTVEESSAAASVMRMQIAIDLNEDGSWDYLDDSRFAPFAKVSVKIGFTGGGGLAGALGGLSGGNDALEPVFDGYVTNVNVSLGAAPNSGQLEVSAMDSSVLMSLEEKIATWPNLSDSDIVQQIVSGYGVPVQADTVPTVHQDTDTTIAQRGTDIQFVRSLAQKNGVEFYFETDKDSGSISAFFRAPQLDGTPQPDLAVQFGDQSNLKSLSIRLTGLRPLNVKAQQIDVKANSASSAQADSSQFTRLGATDENALLGGPLGSLVTPQDAQAQMLVLGPPTSDATELQTIVQAVRDEAGWFLTATGEINSEAYQAVLRPHRVVQLKGAGGAYSGKYYVTRVTHQLRGDGGYEQQFEARRNARDLDGSEQFGGGGLGLPLPGL